MPPSIAATEKKIIKPFGPRLMKGRRDDWNVGFLDRWKNGGRRAVGAAPNRAGETSAGWCYGEGAYMSNNPQPVDTPNISSALTRWQRYPDVLRNAVRQPHYPEPIDALCALLTEMNDPLVLLSSLHIVAKNYLEAIDYDSSRIANLFYASPGFVSIIPDLGPCNRLDPDLEILEEIWEEIAVVAAIFIRCFKEIPCAEIALNESSDEGRRFWGKVIDNDALRQVLKGAFLAGIGKDIRLLDAMAVDSIAICAADGDIDAILFLKNRAEIMLEWLEENLSKEQIIALPALIDYSARLVMLNEITMSDGDSIYIQTIADKIFTADPIAGLQAICRAYAVCHNETDIADILDTLDSALGVPIELKLRELCAEPPDTDCRQGARAILEKYYEVQQ